jgi:hypothetical protein
VKDSESSIDSEELNRLADEGYRQYEAECRKDYRDKLCRYYHDDENPGHPVTGEPYNLPGPFDFHPDFSATPVFKVSTTPVKWTYDAPKSYYIHNPDNDEYFANLHKAAAKHKLTHPLDVDFPKNPIVDSSSPCITPLKSLSHPPSAGGGIM